VDEPPTSGQVVEAETAEAESATSSQPARGRGPIGRSEDDEQARKTPPPLHPSGPSFAFRPSPPKRLPQTGPYATDADEPDEQPPADEPEKPCVDDDDCDVVAGGCLIFGCVPGTAGLVCRPVSFVCQCLPEVHILCDDGSACTVDECNDQGACIHLAGACDDGDPCTQNKCAGVDCTYPPDDGAACSDGSDCTVNDSCLGGSCAAGAWMDCDDADPCTFDTCDGQGGCDHLGLADSGCGY